MRVFHSAVSALQSEMDMVMYLLTSHLGSCIFPVGSGCRISFFWEKHQEMSMALAFSGLRLGSS